MPAYLINGPSTSGKTSIGIELDKRGYKIIDTDETFGYYGNLETEEPVTFPESGHPDEDWYKKNGWLWKVAKVDEAINESKDQPVFFCGGALNESQFYPRFAKIIRLHLDPDKLMDRLSERKDDRHTNNPVFKQRMLEFLETSESSARKLGWAVINTSYQTVTESADQILSLINK